LANQLFMALHRRWCADVLRSWSPTHAELIEWSPKLRMFLKCFYVFQNEKNATFNYVFLSCWNRFCRTMLPIRPFPLILGHSALSRTPWHHCSVRGCEVHMTCDVAVTNCTLRYARSVGRSSRRWDGRWRRPTDRRKSCLLSRRRTDSPWRFGPPSIVCTGRFVSRLRRCHLHCILLLVTQWAPCVALEVIIVKKLNSLKHLVRTTAAESHN